MVKSTLTKGALFALMADNQACISDVLAIFREEIADHAREVSADYNEWLILKTTARLIEEAGKLYLQAPGQTVPTANKLIELCGGEIVFNEHFHLGGALGDANEKLCYAEANLGAKLAGDSENSNHSYKNFRIWFLRFGQALIKRFPEEFYEGTRVMEMFNKSIRLRSLCQKLTESAPAAQKEA